MFFRAALELGGQAPAIVTPSADIDLSAKRILFSKFLNNGQICLSANHVYVDPSVHDKFVERVGFYLNEFLKGDAKDGMTRMISDRNYERVAGLLKGTQGKVAYGGRQDKATKYIQPTVVTDVTMQGQSIVPSLLLHVPPSIFIK